MTVYYSPEKYGLKTVGEVDFSTGSYEFDILAVWQDETTGQLYYAEDSGCSCPSPFEGHDRQTITPFNTLADLKGRLVYRYDDSFYESEKPRVADDIDALLAKVKPLLGVLV